MNIIPLQFPLDQAGQPLSQHHIMAIGDFDGVHSGHRDVIGRVLSLARLHGLPSSIMTFHPHPREVLGQEKYAQSLSPLDVKLQLFQELGIDNVYLVTFDIAFSQVSPQQFVHEMLLPLHPQSIVIGFDFAFGHQGKGTPDLLLQLAEPAGIHVDIVQPFHQNGHKVSSTMIREQLSNGALEAANHLLGRPYMLEGTVVHGEGRGRLLQFPTANVEIDSAFVLPCNGVYTVTFSVQQQMFGGVMNFGYKPTFHEERAKATMEVHVFDFDQMIYGERVAIHLIGFIRQERKFDSIDQLIAQIAADAERARTTLREGAHLAFTL